MAGHDDVFMVCRPEDVLLGLSVDATESRAYSRAQGRVEQQITLYAGITDPVPHTEGVVVFGTPLGPSDWSAQRGVASPAGLGKCRQAST
jgi:hypothetical protein